MSFLNFHRNNNHRHEDPQDGESVLLSIIPDNVKNIKSCCYCFDLKLGCTIIAVLDILSGLFESVVSFKLIRSYLSYDSYRPHFLDMLNRNPIVTLITGLVTCVTALVLLTGVILVQLLKYYSNLTLFI